MVKFNNTERLRKVINDAMDIHGGRAVVGGPRNYLAAMYNAVPIGITVEGANILTRCLMIFGQGAFRCHHHVLAEIQVLQADDAAAFDRVFSQHLRQSSRNAARSFVFGIRKGGGQTPGGSLAFAYRRLNRLSAAFAFAADVAMLSLGGDLKRRESLSGRLADAFSNLYIASACLKRFEREGRQAADLPLAEYAVRLALYETESALAGLIANLPNRWAAALLRIVVLPLGQRETAPSDQLAHQVAADMQRHDEMLERLTRFRFQPQAEVDELYEPLAVLKPALAAARQTGKLEQLIRKAEAKGQLTAETPSARISQAVELQLISEEEAEQLREARRLVKIAITVDDFDMDLNEPNPQVFATRVF